VQSIPTPKSQVGVYSSSGEGQRKRATMLATADTGTEQHTQIKRKNLRIIEDSDHQNSPDISVYKIEPSPIKDFTKANMENRQMNRQLFTNRERDFTNYDAHELEDSEQDRQVEDNQDKLYESQMSLMDYLLQSQIRTLQNEEKP
jgi:hypothetical protein